MIKVRLDQHSVEYDGKSTLILSTGDRFQAANFEALDSKETVIKKLRMMADNIERDELFKIGPKPMVEILQPTCGHAMGDFHCDKCSLF